MECVEEAVLYYWVKKGYYGKADHIKSMNRKLQEVRKHIHAIHDILSDGMIVEYMMKVADAELEDKGGKHLVGFPSAFINRGPVFKEIGDLNALDEVCEVAIALQKPGKGKAKGTKDEALHLFLDKLCECCERSNGEKLTTKPNNLLEQVVKVLNSPLSLGGIPTGLTRKTIEGRNCKI